MKKKPELEKLKKGLAELNAMWKPTKKNKEKLFNRADFTYDLAKALQNAGLMDTKYPNGPLLDVVIDVATRWEFCPVKTKDRK